MSELAAEYGVHPTMIHQWKRSLLDGAAGIFRRGGKASVAAEVAEETVHDPHAKIGEPAVANDFLSRKLGTRISMNGRGRCLDNIFIERLWRSLKCECVCLRASETGSQARAGIGR